MPNVPEIHDVRPGTGTPSVVRLESRGVEAMGEPSVGKIVVGVGPTGRHRAALEYAAAEAVRRGCGIHLVLVVHPRWPGPDGMVELKLVGA